MRYNPYNQSIEILSNAQQVANIVSDLKGDICIIFDALKKIEDSSQESTEKAAAVAAPADPTIDYKAKLIRKYKKLEEAFRNLSLDVHESDIVPN